MSHHWLKMFELKRKKANYDANGITLEVPNKQMSIKSKKSEKINSLTRHAMI